MDYAAFIIHGFIPGLNGQSPGTFWMPPQASTLAPEVDWVFYLILWICIFFFVLIVALMTWFVLHYRKREGHAEEETAHHSMALELTWTIIPLILVVLIFYFGFKTYLRMKVAPANALEIYVIGQKWNWFFQYPNGHIDEDLHLPVDTPVQLIIRSEDVTHSLFIPAFRIKMDAVPGRYTRAWVRAREEGVFPVYCAEYCGTQHSDMLADAIVHEPGLYEVWLEKASNLLNTMTPVEAGQYLVNKRCSQCHSVDGTADVGPSFLGVWGREETLADGSTSVVEENYIRESILEPSVKIAAGYENVMPSFKGKLKEEEITAIIEYLKTLKKD
ncbi:MAG: cytochrome c oxidase subunit II [Candidatus Omnitrophica bacterium]|nr:cytochrome c oxidase subunit II [Candidatus Omnitrophota bacterium]